MLSSKSIIASLLSLPIWMGVTGCAESGHEASKPESENPPLADFSDAARELVEASPEGIAIGEVHGQIASIMLLEAVTEAALETYPTVLVLHEFTPGEAGLDITATPKDSFQTYDITDISLPLWTSNIDKRATWELHAFFEKIAEMPNVSLSYLWDPRLNPPPNKLKAHGMAVRWKIAREARPDAYIVALAGNYHTSSSERYSLEETNSLCRYADEVFNMKLTCVAVDNLVSADENCLPNQKAVVLKGEDVFENWDYVIRRPDRCTVQAQWVNEAVK